MRNKIKDYYQDFFSIKISDRDIFDCLRGEFPNKQQIQSYDIFILTGTKCIELLCADNPVFVDKILTIIKQILDNQKILYGTCFGHQIISHFFGAKIKRRCPKNYWEIGFISNDLNKLGESLIGNSTKNITQITAHHDYVYDITNTNLKPILSNTNSLLFTVGKNNKIQTLTCQGHFLFDDSYFLKHHKNFFDGTFPYKYVKKLAEEQINDPGVKRRYLDSKQTMKKFVKKYLIGRKKLNTQQKLLLDKPYNYKEIIPKCK